MSSESEQDFEEESNASSEQLYCSSSSFNEDDSDVEDGEILGIEPYQFEPEVADDDEPAGSEDADNADLEDRRKQHRMVGKFTSTFSLILTTKVAEKTMKPM